MFARSSSHSFAFVSIVSFLSLKAVAYDVNVAESSSVKDAANAVASNAFSYYQGNKPGNTPGLIDSTSSQRGNGTDRVYWWESAALFDGIINLWGNTQNSQYIGAVQEGMLFQMGDDMNYQPQNQTSISGNDDQGYWALSAMTAEERGLPLLRNANTTYLRLAQTVFDTQAARWDNKTCDGGLRWQWNPVAVGYDYKSTAANAVFFQLAARLYRFTKNETYAQQAAMAYDWMTKVGYIDERDNFAVYDGASVTQQCSQIDRARFSNVASTLMYGAAIMANVSGSGQWHDRSMGFARGFKDFFAKGSQPIIQEVPCEDIGTCTTDMKVYKGMASLFSSLTILMAPYTSDTLRPMLEASARGAAAACTQDSCGFSWTAGRNNGDTGVSQSIAAMDALNALLISPGLVLRTSSSAPVPESSNTFGNVTATEGQPPSMTSSTGSSGTTAPVSSSSQPARNAAATLTACGRGLMGLAVAAIPFVFML